MIQLPRIHRNSKMKILKEEIQRILGQSELPVDVFSIEGLIPMTFWKLL